jgi:hypothetical protein
MSRVERTISNRVAGWVLVLATLMLLLLPATANAVPAAPSGPSGSWTKPDGSVPRAVQQQAGSLADTAWASKIEAKGKKKAVKIEAGGGIVVLVLVVAVILLVRKKRRSKASR